MRQHVNPFSKVFLDIQKIPPLSQIFENPFLPLHLDIGSGSGSFLIQLASNNKNWNYLGIEIREKLVIKANSKINDCDLNNLFFLFGNANILINDITKKFPNDILKSVSINFPDPWFKKKHHKRRVLQPELIDKISKVMAKDSLIFIKTDVKELFLQMDSVIINSQIFKRYANPRKIQNFNPYEIKTARENYALSKNLLIYEQLYIK
tara:strand:+ start:5782 stop:6402 length:621 start_codon:yes stop_codon:yes gene_type:complete